MHPKHFLEQDAAEVALSKNVDGAYRNTKYTRQNALEWMKTAES